MKKLVTGITFALGILAVLTATAFAAPREATMTGAGPFDGTFSGTVLGDNGTSAPLTLELTHRDDQVSGYMFLGSGLYVRGGICGGSYVPAGPQYASGKTAAGDPHRLNASSKVDVGRFDIKVKLESDVSADGEVITAKARLDLPWFCGRDPVLNATLYRARGSVNR